MYHHVPRPVMDREVVLLSMINLHVAVMGLTLVTLVSIIVNMEL